MTNSATVITSMDFADRFFAAATRLGFVVRLNKNGDRQVDFDHKYLTEIDLRSLYRDIIRNKRKYARNDMELLLGGARPCATAPFF